jgi:hypothetical protein
MVAQVQRMSSWGQLRWQRRRMSMLNTNVRSARRFLAQVAHVQPLRTMMQELRIKATVCGTLGIGAFFYKKKLIVRSAKQNRQRTKPQTVATMHRCAATWIP